MSADQPAWTVVGRIADIFQISTTVLGVLAITLVATGKNPFTNPDDTTLVIAAITFGLVGLIAIVVAVVRNQQHNAGFAQNRRVSSRTHYAIGVLMLVLAVGTVSFLIFRQPPAALPHCL